MSKIAKLILKGMPLRINFIILSFLVLLAILFNVIPQNIYFIYVVIVLIGTMIIIIPYLHKSILESRKHKHVSKVNIYDKFLNIFRFRIHLDLRKDEILYEMENLRNQLKIKKKIKLKIVPDFFNAATDGYTVYFGKPLIEILNEDEIQFILAHELAHISKNHVNKKLVIFFGIFLLILILFVFILKIHSFFSLITIFMGIMAMSSRFISWPYEYQADIVAVKLVQKNTLSSTFNKIASIRNIDINRGNYTHPSIHNRIINLDWSPKTRFKKWYFSLE